MRAPSRPRNVWIIVGAVAVVLVVGILVFALVSRPPAAPVAESSTFKPGRVVLSDTFDRTVRSGWGAGADGSEYTLNAVTGFSVADGSARMGMVPGSERVAILGDAHPRDVSVTAVIVAPVVPKPSGGVYVALIVRSDGHFAYRATVRFVDAEAYLSVSRFDGDSTRVVELVTPTLMARKVKPGTAYTFGLTAAGAAPVQLSASLVPVSGGGADIVRAQDDAATRLVSPGSTSIWTYLSGSSRDSTEVRISELTVTELVPA